MCGLAVFYLPISTLRAIDLPMSMLDTALDGFVMISKFIVERWQLYPGMAKKLTMHEFPGPEAIGYAQSWADRHSIEMERISARLRRPYIAEVPDTIYKTYHCRQAAALGLYWLHKEKLELPPWSDWKVIVEKWKPEKE